MRAPGPLAVGRALLAGLALAAAEGAAAGDAPEAALPSAGTCEGKIRLRGLFFEKDDSALDPADKVILDLVAEIIETHCPTQHFVIEGHTDVLRASRLQPPPVPAPGQGREAPPRRARDRGETSARARIRREPTAHD